LCEIIEPFDDESEAMACLVDRWVAFDQTKNGLMKWLTQFGDEATTMNLVSHVEASQGINDVYEQIDAVLKKIVQQKMTQQQFLRSRISSQIIREEETEQERLKAQQEEEEARHKKEDDDKADDGASIDDGKSGGAKTQRSVAQSKGSIRDTS